MASPTTTTAPCPRCGAQATGRFCSACGASLVTTACTACSAQLSPGARFCHRCGTPATGGPGATPAVRKQQGLADAMPWAVAAIALVALISLAAGQRFASARGTGFDAPANALPQEGLDFAGGMPAGTAPDISNMTPVERARRLFNRIMELHTAGLTDSARTWAVMAVPAYEMIGTLDADLRFELGRIGEVTGISELAKAQADTILAENPTHLLGLALAAKAARMRGDEDGARRFERALLAAEKSELAKGLQEYSDHKQDLDAALADARRPR